jgi:hypothetical protein
MAIVDDPAVLDPDQCAREVARLLALGLIRLLRSRPPCGSTQRGAGSRDHALEASADFSSPGGSSPLLAPEKSGKSSRNSLELRPDLRLTVPCG